MFNTDPVQLVTHKYTGLQCFPTVLVPAHIFHQENPMAHYQTQIWQKVYVINFSKAHLLISHGTLVFRSTVVGHHCCTVCVTWLSLCFCSLVLFDLFVNILAHNLAEPAYEADVAQLEYKLVAGEHGLVIRLKGFNHKLPVRTFRPDSQTSSVLNGCSYSEGAHWHL